MANWEIELGYTSYRSGTRVLHTILVGLSGCSVFVVLAPSLILIISNYRSCAGVLNWLNWTNLEMRNAMNVHSTTDCSGEWHLPLML